jgi:hypothetical protein
MASVGGSIKLVCALLGVTGLADGAGSGRGLADRRQVEIQIDHS